MGFAGSYVAMITPFKNGQVVSCRNHWSITAEASLRSSERTSKSQLKSSSSNSWPPSPAALRATSNRPFRRTNRDGHPFGIW